MEPLIEVPYNEWGKLRDSFTVDWPLDAGVYSILDMHIKHPGLEDDFGFKVYCPEGNMCYGMIALSLRDNYNQIIIAPRSSNDYSMSKIKEALLNTKVIDWDRIASPFVLVPAANAQAVECLEAVKSDLGLKIQFAQPQEYILSAIESTGEEMKRRFDVTLPRNTYIGHLKTEHIDLVDKTWLFSSQKSYCFFETLQKHNLVHVLYSRLDDNPLAWICVNNFGALTHLFCLKEHRRKGYADVILKYAINNLLDKGQSALGYISEHNMVVQKLITKMGFKFNGYVSWVNISKE